MFKHSFIKKLLAGLIVVFSFVSIAKNCFANDFLTDDYWQSATSKQVKKSIANGAVVKARNKYGMTPLMLASADNTDPNIVSILIENGADVKARDYMQDWTALMWASGGNQNPAVISTLIKNGADVNAVSKSGWTALMLASGSNQNADIITTLIANGANVKARDKESKWTILMFASGNNPNPDVINILIKNGADINARDETGWTALIWASSTTQNPDIITTLINSGADVKVKDKYGKTAWDYIQKNEYLKKTQVQRLSDKLQGNNTNK